MKAAIVDVGSNTIRTVVYEVVGKSFSPLADLEEYAGLIRFVRDGRLTQEGLECLSQAMGRMAAFLNEQACEVTACFATASLRGIENFSQAANLVKETCGLELKLLSDGEEADCDYWGLRCAVDVQDGLCADLGGGSCQVLRFANAKVEAWTSIPCGCLAMYSRFVKGILPTPLEQEQIRREVYRHLESASGLAGGGQVLYFMGGTAFALQKLAQQVTGQKLLRIPVDVLKKLQEDSQREAEFLPMLEREVPKRVKTILPGLAVVLAVCEFLQVKEIQTVKNGVREGYLWKHICSRNPQ